MNTDTGEISKMSDLEKAEELLKKYAENVSVNHWTNAIHEDKFSELATEIVKLFD